MISGRRPVSFQRKEEWSGPSRPAPKKMNPKIIGLCKSLLSLGARIEEDWLYAKVTLNDCGLMFTKGHSDVYINNFGAVRRVEVLIDGHGGSFHAEYDFLNPHLSVDFWNRAYMMASKLQKRLFWTVWPLDHTVYLLSQVIQEHREKPCRETYLLQRTLKTFLEEEQERWRKLRREKNCAKGQAFCDLMRIITTAPHSLNILRSLGTVRVTEIAPDYWQANALIKGETFSGWGANPVLAADSLLWGNGSSLYQKGINIATLQEKLVAKAG